MAKKIRLRQTKSPIRRDAVQERTVRGLGLSRPGYECEVEDTPAVRGMIRKVAHLVEIIEKR
jgi:large subunit ribosomal protein L30